MVQTVSRFSASGPRHAARYRNARHRVPHGVRPAVVAAGRAARRAAPRRTTAGRTHRRDTEGERHPYLQPAHTHQVPDVAILKAKFPLFGESIRYLLLKYLTHLHQSAFSTASFAIHCSEEISDR